MDSESECDWSPPSEIKIIESEVFEIPSRLPSIEDFIKREQEKVEELLELVEDEADEIVEESQKEEENITIDDVGSLEGSLAEDNVEDQETIAEAADIRSEEEFEIPLVEVKKPKPKPKPKKAAFDTLGIDSIQADFDNIKAQAKQKADEDLRLHLIDSTDNFIDKLIGNVVDICEYEDPDDILRARLDRNRVCEELEEKMFELDIEQKIRFFLNRKAVEYFWRKKTTRPLTDDSPDEIINQIRKYHESLMLVNRSKGLEEPTKNSIKTKILELEKELKKLKEQSESKANEFVDVVKMTFGAENSDKMDTLIDNLTRRMNNMRKEISNVRFVLIQRQHAMAVLQERSRKLDDLGNGLFMVDFEYLQTENQALGKKIEERNNELNRLHSRCNTGIHNLAHIREKQQMVRNTILAQQEALDELIEEKQSCREYLNSLKIERGAIRKEFKMISFQNGLLDKPELLLDYDATEEKVNILKAKVASVKADQLRMDEKINEIMKMLRN